MFNIEIQPIALNPLALATYSNLYKTGILIYNTKDGVSQHATFALSTFFSVVFPIMIFTCGHTTICNVHT